MRTIQLTQLNDQYTPPGRRSLDNIDSLTRITRSLSPRMKRVLDWLAMGGVMSASQLAVNLRSISHYVGLGLIARVSEKELNLQTDIFAVTDGRNKSHTKLFCLGTVGEQIARQRFSPVPPLTGYLTYTPSRIAHDLFLNEIVLRLAETARAQGWRTYWAGTHAAELRKGSEQMMEPDALLILENDHQRKAFAIEYHNEEDKRQRAFEKVRRYERVREQRDLWQGGWEVETFPPVLAVFRDNVVGNGYREAAKELNAQAAYYGKSLTAFTMPDHDLAEWVNAKTGGRERLF